MLVNGKAETIPIPKVFTMLEMAPQFELEKLPSPRVLNSHFPLCILPEQIKGIVQKTLFITTFVITAKFVITSIRSAQKSAGSYIFSLTVPCYS